MSKPPKIKSSYAILDVETGRKALERHLKQHGGVLAVIHAVITDPHGSDDGTSIEFNCDVMSVELRP